MAGKDVTIVGLAYLSGPNINPQGLTAPISITIIGQEFTTGLSVGGGPIIPPDQPPVGGSPPHPAFPIWGPPGTGFPDKPGYPPVAGHPIAPGGPPNGPGRPPGVPTFPIWGPPGITFPPGSGYPPVAGHPLPPPGGGTPGEPPKPIIGWEAKVIWTTDTGWAVIVVPKEDTLVPTPSQ